MDTDTKDIREKEAVEEGTGLGRSRVFMLLMIGAVMVIFAFIIWMISQKPANKLPATSSVTVTPKPSIAPTYTPIVVPSGYMLNKGGKIVPIPPTDTPTPAVQKSGGKGGVGMENPGLTGNPSGGSKTGKSACTDPKPGELVYTNEYYDKEDKQYLGDHGKEATITKVYGPGILVIEFTQDKFPTPADCRGFSYK